MFWRWWRMNWDQVIRGLPVHVQIRWGGFRPEWCSLPLDHYVYRLLRFCRKYCYLRTLSNTNLRTCFKYGNLEYPFRCLDYGLDMFLDLNPIQSNWKHCLCKITLSPKISKGNDKQMKDIQANDHFFKDIQIPSKNKSLTLKIETRVKWHRCTFPDRLFVNK